MKIRRPKRQSKKPTKKDLSPFIPLPASSIKPPIYPGPEDGVEWEHGDPQDRPAQ